MFAHLRLLAIRSFVREITSREQSPSGTSAWDSVGNLILILVFLSTLAVVGLGVFHSQDVVARIEESEGRHANPFPVIQMKSQGLISRPESESIKNFPSGFERWFQDRMGYREQLIYLYQVARYSGWTPGLLSTGKTQSSHAAAGVLAHGASASGSESGRSRVLIGRDGWLFYQSPKVMNDYRGLDLLTDEELEAWKTAMLNRRQWLEKRGIRFLFVITPNKHTIYPEYIPRSIVRVTENSRARQLAKALSECGVPVLNLEEALLRAKSEGRLFHKTDTHWNAKGAFIGSQEILTWLQQHEPGLTVPTREDYRTETHVCDQHSVHDVAPWVALDLVKMQGVAMPYREELVQLTPRKEHLKVSPQFEGAPRSEEERIRTFQRTSGTIPSVYFVHDSFMMEMSTFLAPHFRKMTYHWTDEFPAEAIDQARPKWVIQQVIQRHLMELKPTNPEVIQREF